MKLEKVREEIYYFSQKAGEASQKLALSGIAIIWLFKSTDGSVNTFPLHLYWSLLLFIATLFIEFIHYLIFAPIWAIYYKKMYNEIHKTKKVDVESHEVPQPAAQNQFGWFLFGAKAITLLLGYAFFMVYMWQSVMKSD
jgi:hypothetical protein